MIYNNEIVFHKVKIIDDDNISKIRIKEVPWENLFKNKEYLYEKIADLLLCEENLLYYATIRESAKTLDDTKKYIQKMIRNGTLKINIEEVLDSIGWNDKLNINNTVFQGDLAEYLMSIFLDKLTNTKTLISKISLKTSARMPVHGNDNYYYDYDNEILYFGESKFYSNAEEALENALDSIKLHNTISEIRFVKNHTSTFIASDNETRKKMIEIFDEVSIEDVDVKNIIFIMHDDIYIKDDYKKMLVNYFGGMDELKKETIDIILVFLPVLSKGEFLEYFYRRINNE